MKLSGKFVEFHSRFRFNSVGEGRENKVITLTLPANIVYKFPNGEFCKTIASVPPMRQLDLLYHRNMLTLQIVPSARLFDILRHNYASQITLVVSCSLFFVK